MSLVDQHLTITRDAIIFFTGLVVFLNQAFFVSNPDPTITYGALAAMGVSAFLRGVTVTAERINGKTKS